jgi:hemolysin activation/secretion protein
MRLRKQVGGSNLDIKSEVDAHDIPGSRNLSCDRSAFWAFDLGYNKGLDRFDAVQRGATAAVGAEPEFSRFSATTNATTPFEISG